MKTLPIALQVYSVRNEAQKDFLGTMKEIKKMGYDGVELAGIQFGYTPVELKKSFKEIGLNPISAHVPISDFFRNPEEIVDVYATIGCNYIAIPYLSEEQRMDTGKFGEILELINKIGEICKRKGIGFLYHNHDFEFKTMADGTYYLDYLYQITDKEILQTELDTCWVKVGGEDPANYLRKYTGRSPLIHLKDYIGSLSDSSFMYRALGYGCMDIKAILDASIDAKVSWVVVEQDEHNDFLPMENMKRSREYLKGLGW